jgi:membrane protein DedA with SNARE-associated domain
MVGVVVAGTAGSLAGALLWYTSAAGLGWSGSSAGRPNTGAGLTVSPVDVDRAAAWFDRRGGVAVLIGRLMPAVRTLISVPAASPAWPCRGS